MIRFKVRWLGFVTAALATTACGDALETSEEPTGAEAAPLTFGTCGANCSSWVYPSALAFNHLIYVPDDEGDRIPDFSRIGYKKSKGGLLSETAPAMGTRLTYAGPAPRTTDTNICAMNGANPLFDHGPAIQAALDDLADNSENSSGVRGHLFLPKGHYAVWQRLLVRDGVVLRGEGDVTGALATTLHTCAPTTLITVGQPGDEGGGGDPETFHYNILDEVVPVGATSVTISMSSSTTIQRTDRILITRQNTEGWIEDLGASDTWLHCPAVDPLANPPVTREACFRLESQIERTVTHVERVPGTTTNYRIFFEHPLTNALELRSDLRYGQHFLQRYNNPPQRAQFSGVYNLRGQAHCDPDCSPNSNFIVTEWAIDSWVQDVVASGFGKSAVTVGAASRQVTVENASYVSPGGPVTGGHQYGVQVSGVMNLVANSKSDRARHSLMALQSSVGPNAFVKCTGTNASSDAATHQDWAYGTLFDTVNISADPIKCTGANRCAKIAAANHSISDVVNTDSHGWMGANLVVWNARAAGYEVFNPPTAQNWLIGSIGEPRDQPNIDETTSPPSFHDLHESPPHYDYGDANEHGTPVSLGSSDPSLFVTSNAKWRAYLGGNYEMRHYFVGNPDQPGDEMGGPGGGDDNDPVYVNSAFRDWVVNRFGAPQANFDFPVTNHSVPFTVRYQLEPGESVNHAYLAVRVERTTWTDDAYHHVTIAGSGYAQNAFTTWFVRCNGTIPNCVQMPADRLGPIGWPTSLTYAVVRVLDLGGLPYFNDKDANGWVNLNVNFFKRMRLDWAALTLLVRRP